jgi:hypothetical protein
MANRAGLFLELLYAFAPSVVTAKIAAMPLQQSPKPAAIGH